MEARVLVIDDNEMVCRTIQAIVREEGIVSELALTLGEGREKAHAGAFDVVFLDVRLPDGNGLQALPDILGSPSGPEVIIITGEGDPDGAELAITSGAWDYVEKPLSVQAIKLPLLRCLQYRQEKMARKPPMVLRREGIIGESGP